MSGLHRSLVWYRSLVWSRPRYLASLSAELRGLVLSPRANFMRVSRKCLVSSSRFRAECCFRDEIGDPIQNGCGALPSGLRLPG